MKKIILLFIAGFAMNLCIAQTAISIKNKTGVTLDIGISYIADTDNYCDGAPEMTAGVPAVASGSGVTIIVPSGFKLQRVGGTEIVPPFDSHWEMIDCSGGTPITCGTFGTYDVFFYDCTAIDIN